MILLQAPESSGRDEPLPVAAGDHVQERPQQLQAEDQQAQLHQGVRRLYADDTDEYETSPKIISFPPRLFQDTEQKKSGNYFFLDD